MSESIWCGHKVKVLWHDSNYLTVEFLTSPVINDVYWHRYQGKYYAKYFRKISKHPKYLKK